MKMCPSEHDPKLLLPDGDAIIRVIVTQQNIELPKEEVNRNVFRVDREGRIKWRVAYHEIDATYGNDGFVGVRLGPAGEILGTTFTGFTFEIGLEDGSLKKKGWTK